MNKFSEVLAKIENLFIIFSGGLIVVLMILTVIDVSGRSLFRVPLVGVVEISELIMVGVITLAIAGTQRTNGHIGMDIVLDKLKEMKRPAFPQVKILGLVLTEAIFLFTLFFALKLFMVSFGEGETTVGPLYVAAWPVRGILCLGVFLMCLRLAIQILQTIPSVYTWRSVK